MAKLSLFSANEQLADIATRDLVYILVPYVLSEVLSRVRTTDREERIDLVSNVKVRCNTALLKPRTLTVPDRGILNPSSTTWSYMRSSRRRTKSSMDDQLHLLRILRNGGN